MRIILAGGGTGGPAVPLIAVAQQIKKEKPDALFLYLGSATGPEKTFADKYGIPFKAVISGKLRRYFSLQNILSPFLVIIGFFQALGIISRFNPDLIFSAGGFVSVPVAIAGKILGKKVLIHQQDVVPTLSNKIISPFADKITAAFESSVKDFNSGWGLKGASGDKVIWTGNPVREDLLEAANKNPQEIKKQLGLHNDLPVIYIVGGATGALGLNLILKDALPELVKIAQIIHSTGVGKGIDFKDPNYHPYDLVENVAEVYAVSDIVIARAGLATMTELSALKKVSIIVPMPDSHQFYNAQVLDETNSAVVLDQKLLTPDMIIQTAKRIMYNGDWANEMKENIFKIFPPNASQRISKQIISLCEKK